MDVDDLLGDSKLDPYTLVLRYVLPLFSCSAKRAMHRFMQNAWRISECRKSSLAIPDAPPWLRTQELHKFSRNS